MACAPSRRANDNPNDNPIDNLPLDARVTRRVGTGLSITIGRSRDSKRLRVIQLLVLTDTRRGSTPWTAAGIDNLIDNLARTAQRP
jgi:hypothetical protein